MSDHWEIYMSENEQHLVRVLVDMGIAQEAPRQGLAQLVKLGIYLQRPDEDGLDDLDENEALDHLEDALSEGLSDLEVETDYVGRITSDGKRALFYYTGDPAVVEACLAATMATVPDYQYAIYSEADPKWDQYFDILYPTEREQQVIGNGHVLQSLRDAGDNFQVERDVFHWTYFPESGLRNAYQREVHELGYRSTDQQDQATGDNPFSLCISKATSLEYDTINEVTLELFDLAEKYQGEYTGWETSVQRGS